MRRILVLAALIAALAAVPALASERDTPSSAASSSRIACGAERWTVKTLQDRPTLLPARTTTVHYLVTRPAPTNLPATRLPFERHIFTVTAAVVLVRPEADSDLHVVLSSGNDEMIAEAPSPSCDSRALPLRRRQMTAARSHVQLCARARVTGVAFFDFDHGQTGVASNAIEFLADGEVFEHGSDAVGSTSLGTLGCTVFRGDAAAALLQDPSLRHS